MPATVERQGPGSGRTVARLLGGVVWRGRPALLMWIWMVPLAIRMLAKDNVDVHWVMAASMGLSFILGLSEDNVHCREHRILPVTERQLWVTRWLNSTLVMPVYLLILKCLGMAIATSSGRVLMTSETLALSTLYDVVYAGAIVAVPSWLRPAWAAVAKQLDRIPLPVGSPQRKMAGWITIASVFIVLPALFLLGMGGPFLIARQLPTRFADLSMTSSMLLVAGVLMALTGLIRTPPRGGASAHLPAMSRPAAPPKPAVGDGLTGVSSVLWSHIRTTFVLACIAIAAFIAAAPFLDRAGEPRFARMLTTMFLTLAFLSTSQSSVWTPWVRQLKVLPLSARQVNALFVFTPIVTWVEIWLLLRVVHAVLSLPLNVELSPLAVLMYAGLVAMNQAVALAFTGGVARRMVGSMIGFVSAAGGAAAVVEAPDSATRLALMAVVAAASLAIAALVNHYTLTKSTSLARAHSHANVAMRP